MGFHLLDLLPIIIIGLLLLGPKTLNSVARNAGKGLSKAKKAKSDLLSDLPIEELTEITNKIPMSPQQAVFKLLTPEQEQKKKSKTKKSLSPSAETEEKENIS